MRGDVTQVATLTLLRARSGIGTFLQAAGCAGREFCDNWSRKEVEDALTRKSE